MLIRRLIEVDWLYCVLLGRRAEGVEALDMRVGMSINQVVHDIIASTEFEEMIVGSVMSGGQLRHADLGMPDWQGALRLACDAQLIKSPGLPYFVARADVADGRRTIDCLFWEILRRGPDEAERFDYENRWNDRPDDQGLTDLIDHLVKLPASVGDTMLVAEPPAEQLADRAGLYTDLIYNIALSRHADESGRKHHLAVAQQDITYLDALFRAVFGSAEAQEMRRHTFLDGTGNWRAALARIMSQGIIASIIRNHYPMLAADFGTQLDLWLIKEIVEQPVAVEAPPAPPYHGRPMLSGPGSQRIYARLTEMVTM